ncbi:MAG: hypothetical protein GX801_11955 [Fibrobacter sp.]|nr:hypothetical protein [Fibrobacter sp.]
MQGKVLIVLLLVFIAMANAISVYTLDEQFSQTNQTVLRFKVENNSLDTLYGIELRYRVVQDTNNIASPDLYYLPGGMANWVFEDSVNATLIIYFPDLILYPGDTLGGSSGFAVGLHNKNWSVWTKNDDPSQPASHTFTQATNIDLLSNGKSLMLSGKKYPGCPIVQFVEIHKDSLTLQILQQLSSDTAKVIIKNRLGDSLIADFNSITTDSSGQKFWRGALATQDTVEHRGELRAECKGNLLSYFAFGWKPTGAESATMQSLWESNEAFVKANFDMGFNQGLSGGQRLTLQRDSIGKYLDARLVNNWKFYRTWEEPGENPMPVVLSPALMQYDADDLDSLTLEWSPIDAGDWYRLVVIRDTLIDDSVAFIDTTISLFTQRTLLSIPMLDPGNYMWYVEPLLEVSAEDHDDDAEYYYITGDAANTSAQSGSAPLMFRASFLTKLKKLAGKTVKTATLYARPVAYAGLSGLNFTSIVSESVVRSLSPFGFIQIFSPDKVLFTKINPITKNMDWLQYSYHDDFRYTKPINEASAANINRFKQCFGPDFFAP